LPPPLEPVMKKVAEEYEKIKKDPEFLAELSDLRKRFIGRPSPIYHCKNLSRKIGGAQIYLKREDLNHTGSHKINHCLGEALLAKKMGKQTLIAETGAGQHGVALATAAALMEMQCEIHMGEVSFRTSFRESLLVHLGDMHTHPSFLIVGRSSKLCSQCRTQAVFRTCIGALTSLFCCRFLIGQYQKGVAQCSTHASPGCQGGPRH